MISLRLNDNKNLSLVKRNALYEGENKADTLKIILPKKIRDKNVQDLIINLNILNSEHTGDVVDISRMLEEYNEDLYICEILIENTYTYMPGKISLWIEVLDNADEMVLKTNVITVDIKEHPSVEDFIPEQQLTLLVQWQKDVNDIYGDMQKLHTDTEEYMQQASDAAVSAKQSADEINILYAKIIEITPDSEALGRHIGDTSNPHKVTAKDVGLDKVDNTSDADKPISTATQEALDAIEAEVGDISVALDSINALQDKYIGGETE